MPSRSLPSLRALAIPLTCALLCFGCGDDSTDAVPAKTLSDAELQPAVTAYADMVLATYQQSLILTKAHVGAIDALAADPSEATLKAARDSWLVARDVYGQSEGFRFYDGPIDGDINGEEGPEGQINAWPMDEAFVDYTTDSATTGLVNDTTFVISAQNIAAKNGEGNEESNVSTGYHAIEFLLWGQDTSTTGPGARPFTDFVDGGTAANQDRRKDYLKVTGQMLVADLETVTNQWTPDQDNYRRTFLAMPPKSALSKMLSGMGNLSGAELSGERMEVALKNKDQEDEHSCFSDNTHADIIANAQSIENIYLGKFGDFDGPGIDTLLEQIDPDLNTTLKAQLAQSIALAKAIPVPFDNALKDPDGQAKIKATIDALRAQTATISKAATALGVPINLEE